MPAKKPAPAAGPATARSPAKSKAAKPKPLPKEAVSLKPGERVAALVNEYLAMKEELAAAEQTAKDLKKRMTVMEEVTLPTLLQEIGTGGLETDRARVKVGAKVLGSLSRAKDPDAAVAYLKGCGFDGEIKQKLVCDFLPSEENAAKAAVADLLSTYGKEATLEHNLHPQTLMAWARLRLKDGEPVDLDKVGLTAMTVAAVTSK